MLRHYGASLSEYEWKINMYTFRWPHMCPWGWSYYYIWNHDHDTQTLNHTFCCLHAKFAAYVLSSGRQTQNVNLEHALCTAFNSSHFFCLLSPPHQHYTLAVILQNTHNPTRWPCDLHECTHLKFTVYNWLVQSKKQANVHNTCTMQSC